jgi:hypothetical protein
LIHLYPAIAEPDVRRDDIADPQPHHVARHQFGGRDRLPAAVPPCTGGDRQPLAQQGKCGLCAIFLEKTDQRVENEQGGDHAGLDPSRHDHIQNDGEFEHPWHHTPELAQQGFHSVGALLRHRVGAESLQSLSRFLARQSFGRGGQHGNPALRLSFLFI